MNPQRRFAAQALAPFPAFGLLPSLACARDKCPTKPITCVAPFPVGGTTDILTRLIALKLGPALGTTVVVERKTGAAQNTLPRQTRHDGLCLSASGSSQHMWGELFKSLTGIDLVHVPYLGSGPAMQ